MEGENVCKTPEIMNITVVGTGYVGLSLAVLLAQHNAVKAITTTPEKADKINDYISPIKDNEIEQFFNEAKAGERKLDLTATVCKEDAYKTAEVIIIAVPTDYDDKNNTFDTSIVDAVMEEAVSANPDALIVIKSTVPVGYTDKLKEKYSSASILFSPEFLRESKALYDNLYPARIVIGADESQKDSAQLVGKLLQEGSVEKNAPVLIMLPAEAEAVKLFANSYLAVRISFFNELDTYAEKKGLDPRRIIDGVCKDPRIGEYYNNPSFGYGGYCLPKDTKQLLANYEDVPQTMIEAVVKSNAVRKQFIADTILSKKPAIVGIYRLTMKRGSDNFREAAVHEIMNILGQKGIKIIIFEPVLKEDSYCGHKVEKNLDAFLQKSDIILANRYDSALDTVADKVFTRDLFFRD